jgi:hypothetical protein
MTPELRPTELYVVRMKVENQRSGGTPMSRVHRWMGSLSPFVLVFVPLSIFYLATANLNSHAHIDPLTNALTGWHIGMTGSVILPDHAEATEPEQYANVAWIVESPRGPVSQYPPGAAALSAPLYRLSGEPLADLYVEGFNNPDAPRIDFPFPSARPATITAALATAAAMGFLAAAITYAGVSRATSIGAGLVGGLGTTMWAVASDALWQHGPASMWLALGVLLVARSQLWWAGLAFGAALITRPHTALIAAAVGLSVAISQRSVIPVIKVGVGSLAGLGGLLWYNWWLWGELTISGGYGSGFSERLTSADSLSYVENVVTGLFDPSHGLFLYSPFLLVLIPGFRAAWKALPDWGRGAALGALVYLLFQFKANRSSGGAGFVGYRYPLEALTAAGVLLALSYVHWVEERTFARRVFWAGVGVALLAQIHWRTVIAPVRG